MFRSFEVVACVGRRAGRRSARLGPTVATTVDGDESKTFLPTNVRVRTYNLRIYVQPLSGQRTTQKGQFCPQRVNKFARLGFTKNYQ